MKTSVNFPDGLVERVQALAPDVPFGELVRDALLIALPQWEAEAEDGPVAIALQVKLRAVQATAALEGVQMPRRYRRPTQPTRPAKPQAQAPDTPPARPRARGKRSATKAPARSSASAPAAPKQARSRRK